MTGRKKKYRLPDTCGSCIYFATRNTSDSSYCSQSSHCRCWSVKGRGGGYAARKSGCPACEHYMPAYTAGLA